MKDKKRILLGLAVIMAFGLAVLTGCTRQEGEEQGEKEEMELPAAVEEVVKANFPDAQIDFIEVSEEAGITLYDIEFKADKGEIELTADGTVLDVVTIITMEDLPQAAADAIQKASEGATIKRLEKSEVRAEIKKEGAEGKIVKLGSPRYVYEAELVKDGQAGEIEVDAEGKVIEPLKWDTKGSEEKDK